MTSRSEAAAFVRHDSKTGRWYTVNGQRYPSVTTILGCIHKPALVGWAASEERKAVIEAAASLHGRLVTEGLLLPASVYRTTLDCELGKVKQHVKTMEAAQDIGTQVHSRIEWTLRVLLGQVVPPEPVISDPALVAFMAWEDWAKSVRLEPLFVETTVYSVTHRYAGTMDLLARVNGVVTLVDWKSGKSIYPEAFLQSAAYQMAAREMGLPAPQDGLIVRLPKTLADPAFETAAVPAAETLFPTFLAARDVWAWSYAQEKAYQAKRRAEKAAQAGEAVA